MLRRKRVWLGLAISAACLYLVFASLDVAALGAALRQVNPVFIGPALVVFFGGVWLRSLRWRLLLRPALGPAQRARLGAWPLFRVLIIGLTVNNLLPARLGELARAYLLWREQRVEPGATVATIVLERVLDGLTLVLFAGLAALLVPFPDQLQRAAVIAGAVFLTAAFGLVLFLLVPAPFLRLARAVLHWLPPRLAYLGERLLQTFVEGLGVLRQGRALAAVLALSILAWTAEATMYFLIMLGFPFGGHFAAALLGTAAANIGTMVPSSPGYVGTFDLPLQLVLVEVFHVARADATSYTLVVHAALVLPVIALGLVLLWQDWRQAEATPGATSPRGLFAALTALAQQRPARSPQADR
jgi:uncharacterized protein (TIRG00374 family)